MRRPTFRRFALYTTALTGVLVALGVYTAATGSGLACSQQWPLCDGGVLPHSLPSFVEWFHRLVAMLTGFLIAGTAVWAWRRPVDRRSTLAATAALVLLPLQVAIGAVTVTLNGTIPSGYSVPTQAAHLLVALTIFTALTLATLFAHESRFRSPPGARSRRALFAVLAVLPLNALLGRATPLLDYAPWAQAGFVLTGLVAYAGLVGAAVWLRDPDNAGLRPAVLGAAVAVFGVLLLGRDLVAYTTTAHLANWLLYALAFALVAAAAWVLHRAGDETAGAPA